MGQLHQARQEAVVRQLVFTIEGVCGRRREVRQAGASSFTLLPFTNVQRTNVDVVFTQSHQGEEEDVPVDAPGEEEG